MTTGYGNKLLPADLVVTEVLTTERGSDYLSQELSKF